MGGGGGQMEFRRNCLKSRKVPTSLGSANAGGLRARRL